MAPARIPIFLLLNPDPDEPDEPSDEPPADEPDAEPPAAEPFEEPPGEPLELLRSTVVLELEKLMLGVLLDELEP